MFDEWNQKDLTWGQGAQCEDYGKTIPLVAANAEEGNPGETWPAWQATAYPDVGMGCGMPFAQPAAPILVGEGGVLTGQRFAFLGEETKIGVDPAKCGITLPLGTPGVSRQHLRFWLYEGAPCAMDLGSTYGSYCNGERMKPGLLYRLKTGDRLLLGSCEEFRVE